MIFVVLGLLTHLCSFMFAGGVPTEILIEVSAVCIRSCVLIM